LSGISEHVPSPSNAAAVNGVWADAAAAVSTVLFSSAVVSAAVSAAVEPGDEDADVGAGEVDAGEEGAPDVGSAMQVQSTRTGGVGAGARRARQAEHCDAADSQEGSSVCQRSVERR
jgi:hypothetical protein